MKTTTALLLCTLLLGVSFPAIAEEAVIGRLSIRTETADEMSAKPKPTGGAEEQTASVQYLEVPEGAPAATYVQLEWYGSQPVPSMQEVPVSFAGPEQWGDAKPLASETMLHMNALAGATAEVALDGRIPLDVTDCYLVLLDAAGVSSITVRNSQIDEIRSEDSLVLHAINSTVGGQFFEQDVLIVRGGELEPAGDCQSGETEHVYGQWSVTIQPTCSTEGEMLRVCMICGAAQCSVLPKEPHDLVHTQAIAPTCISSGRSVGSSCSVCGITLDSSEIIPATGHRIIEFAEVPASCTQDGAHAGTACEVCGETLSGGEAIPAAGHQPTALAATPPTCTQPGLTEGGICAVCDETLKKQTAVPPTGHFPVTLPAVPPAADAEGRTEGLICEICGTVLKAQSPIPPLDGRP